MTGIIRSILGSGGEPPPLPARRALRSGQGKSPAKVSVSAPDKDLVFDYGKILCLRIAV